jgi:hypothetical protein
MCRNFGGCTEAKMTDAGHDPAAERPLLPLDAAKADASLGTFDGLRRVQQAEFMALSFREKLERLEQMAEVAERLRLRKG